MRGQLEPLKSLLDELPILEIYANDLGFPYNVVLELKINEMRTFLEGAISKELAKANNKPKHQNNHF